MFCNQCGRELVAEARFCIGCGKPVASAPRPIAIAVTTRPPANRVSTHLQPLGILWLVYGVLRGLGLFWILFVGRAIVPWVLSNIPGLPANFSLAILVSAGMLIGAAITAVSAFLALVTAWGLLCRQGWCRVFGLIAGIFSLLSFPLGTALGIYTLWVLLPASSEAEYQNLARA